MRQLEVRAIHSVPAFAAAVLGGAVAMGLAVGSIGAYSNREVFPILAGPVSFAAFSFLFVPIVAPIFFVSFFVLRQFKLLNAATLSGVGLVAGFAIGCVLRHDEAYGAWPTILYSVAGLVGGSSAFFVLQWCARRDALGS